MAEGIIIHFSEVSEATIISRLETKFASVEGLQWRYPEDDYLISVSRYTDYASEYDADDRAAVMGKLHSNPSVSFNFELRRSRSDEACDVLEAFVRERFCDFRFVADDMFRLYSRMDLEAATDFLDVYRYQK